MSRGYFNFISDHHAYQELNKNWHIELLTSTFFWFDLIVDPSFGVDFQKAASDHMKEVQKKVEESTDKRFVYFLATRERVRFSTKRKPRYSIFMNKIYIYVEVGVKRKTRRLEFFIPKNSYKPELPEISEDGRFITIPSGNRKSTSIPIHQFLVDKEIELGINTEIQYIGSTDDPADRPLKRKHRGYSDVVYFSSPDKFDIFVYYNLFKVTSITTENDSPISFAVSNALIDDVRKREEGEIVEHCLINYFETKAQELNRENELAGLKNYLSKLWLNKKIQKITFDIEMENHSEFFRFFSRKVDATDRHHFSCALEGEAVIIGEPVEIQSYLRN